MTENCRNGEKTSEKNSVSVSERHHNLSGFDIKPCYHPEDAGRQDYKADIGLPGEYPFTRGIHRDMYRERLWTVRQLGSLGPPSEANSRIRNLLQMGATGVSICFDLPTIMGRDSDDPRSKGEVGTAGGVSIDSLEDMRSLLEGIPLSEVSINFVSNSQSCIILAMFAAVAEERKIPLTSLAGTMQNDILKEYQAQKSYYFPPRPSMRLTMDTVEFCNNYMPKFNPISISGYHLASAGATPVQELSFTLANGFTYVEEAMRTGMPVDSFAPRLSFFFKVHNDFFENIAKFRAARRIWSRNMRLKYGAEDPRSWKFRVHTQTSGSSLTAQQPENNIIRVALQALSAVLAGTQSLHTNSFDEAFSIPTDRSEKLALRTQQIIAYESGVSNTVDPLAGSYYLECLTDQMEAECSKYLKEIEDQGGVIAGIEKGYFQRAIAESGYRYQREVDTGRRVVVGLNRFVEGDRIKSEMRELNEEFENNKISQLASFKRKRDRSSVRNHIEMVRKAVGEHRNVMPVLIEAVKNNITLGEIIGVMREEFGEFKEESIF